ncbi:MAG: nucleoside hydrolase [Roseateles sp.]|uniref:nucleoside hydrolase n=1 Tax=Roseateles sp. TaxID=1971397 RepID=UPI0039E9F252
MRPRRPLAVLAALLLAAAARAAPLPVVVDLDIGDDIDDGFALALVLASPALEVRGITTAWGDTALRARMVRRLLQESGREGIPVHAGLRTASQIAFSQARWAAGPRLPGAAEAPPPGPAQPDAVEFLLRQARRQPGQVTLLALGPLTNVAAALRRDPQGFRQFKQVVLMGGSVRAGYSKSDYRPARPPDREYNIVADTPAAQALFASGVPLVMMPLDATALRLDDQRRAALFSHGSTLTDALALMYLQWTHADQPWASATPTLFDVVPVAWLLDPALCPTTPLRIEVDAEGYTREAAGAPNAAVCLAADKPRVLERLMQALLR